MEFDRLKALSDLEILDTAREEAFDGIVELACLICETPMSAISFIDSDRQWFKASVGLNVRETARDVAFCDHVVQDDAALVVPDASKDNRFSENPLVTSEPNIRFYAGVPIKSPNGHNLGAVCVLDSKQRKQDRTLLKNLDILRKQVEVLLQHRQVLKQLGELEAERINFVKHLVHDIKNPLAIIDLSLGYVNKNTELDGKTQKMLENSMKNSGRINQMVEDLLDQFVDRVGKNVVEDSQVNLQQLLTSTADEMRPLCATGQNIHIIARDEHIQTDRKLLTRVIENLISNAIKYSEESDIEISARKTGKEIEIRVSDQGPGISDQLKEKIFEMGVNGDSDFLSSHGIGMHFCRTAVNLLAGCIDVCDNNPRGAIIKIILPLKMPSNAKAQERTAVADG